MEKITLQELIDQGRTNEYFYFGNNWWSEIKPTSPGKCRITRKDISDGRGHKYLPTDRQVEVEPTIKSENITRSGNIKTHRG